MVWWSYLISPVGRYLAVAALAMMVLGTVYVKIRSDAISETIALSDKEALRRTQDAIAAGDSVDVSPERLLEDDGHRRE
jgi:hypothetical protein